MYLTLDQSRGGATRGSSRGGRPPSPRAEQTPPFQPSRGGGAIDALESDLTSVFSNRRSEQLSGLLGEWAKTSKRACFPIPNLALQLVPQNRDAAHRAEAPAAAVLHCSGPPAPLPPPVRPRPSSSYSAPPQGSRASGYVRPPLRSFSWSREPPPTPSYTSGLRPPQLERLAPPPMDEEDDGANDQHEQ